MQRIGTGSRESASYSKSNQKPLGGVSAESDRICFRRTLWLLCREQTVRDRGNGEASEQAAERFEVGDGDVHVQKLGQRNGGRKPTFTLCKRRFRTR